MPNRTPMTLAEKLALHTQRMPGGCLEWTGHRSRTGYGKVNRPGRRAGTVASHRAAWEVAHGPIPDGIYVLHRCDNPPCCDPAHLFLGDQQTNMTDMMAKRRHRAFSRTTCPRGHAYSHPNETQGGRSCRECMRLATARYRQRQKEKACKTSQTSAGG